MHLSFCAHAKVKERQYGAIRAYRYPVAPPGEWNCEQLCRWWHSQSEPHSCSL